MSLVVVSQTVEEVLSLSQAKKQCYIPVDDTADDDLLFLLINAAVEYFQGRTWRGIYPTVYDLRLSGFGDALQLTRFPVNSVTSVKYFAGGVEKTLAADKYRTNLPNGLIYPVESFPSSDERFDAVTVRFSAGNAAQATADAKIAMLMHVKFLYDNRDAVAVSDSGRIDAIEPPLGASTIMDSLSLREFV